MGTLFDYLDWRGDLSFSACPLGEVDNLIFSNVCYLDFEGIISDKLDKSIMYLTAMKRYKQLHKGEVGYLGLIFPTDMVKLATKAARSERFGRTRVAGHINIIDLSVEMQFSATTFLLDDNSCFVSFRGSDDTLVAWKENFNMSFMSTVPAQEKALEYLEDVARTYPQRHIYVGGHSKGGNLAIYAAAKCSPEVKERIACVYSNDSPGFSKEFLESEGYAGVKDRVKALVPQSSVIGLLLEHVDGQTVVKSNHTGLYQHDCLGWEIKGKSLVHLDKLTADSQSIDRTLKVWLSDMSTEKRRRIVNTVYDIISSDSVKTLTELNADKKLMLKAWNSLDVEDRKYIRQLAHQLVKISTSRKKDSATQANTIKN